MWLIELTFEISNKAWVSSTCCIFVCNKRPATQQPNMMGNLEMLYEAGCFYGRPAYSYKRSSSMLIKFNMDIDQKSLPSAERRQNPEERGESGEERLDVGGEFHAVGG